jgi:hypothetical protein
MTTDNIAARENLRTMVRGAYDIQKLRISMGNRIVGQFKKKLGQEAGETEEDSIDAEGKVILETLRLSFHKMADGVASGFVTPKKFKADGVISNYTEYCLVAEYTELDDQEKKHFRRLEHVLLGFDIYNEFLEPIKGIGPAMAGVLISEINIAAATYPSSLWAYAGLDVAGDGRGRSRRREHLVERVYTNKEGEQATRMGITFNPFLKTKLMGVLASSFLRAGKKDNLYRDIYDGYKHRLESNPAHAEKSKGHRHNMAMRYTVKQFLTRLHIAWRTLEGLPVSAPYHEDKLKLFHEKGESVVDTVQRQIGRPRDSAPFPVSTNV